MNERPAPCEDKKASVSKTPAHSYFERQVLCSHRQFRLSVLRNLVLFAATPVLIYLGVTVLRSVLSETVDSSTASLVLLLALGIVATASAMGILWTVTVFQVEQRFARIRRQWEFAAESVSVDNEAHAAEAVATLSRTWLYRLVLLRWLRDLRRSIVLVAVLTSLVGALVVSNASPLQAWLLGWDGQTCVLVLGLSLAASFVLVSRLLAKASKDAEREPDEAIIARLRELLGEVKALRRGRLA